MGFNALIHSHRPDLFDYSKLQPNRNIENLNHAFNVANDELGINRLLDAEDVDTARPDEKSILTYVASYYHTFARMKNEQKSGKRIANVSINKYHSVNLLICIRTILNQWPRRRVMQIDSSEAISMHVYRLFRFFASGTNCFL